MAVTEETEAQVREDRRAAEKYADRVRNGERPWEDAETDVNDTAPDSNGDVDEQPINGDVGETTSDTPEVVEVEQPTE